MIIGYQGEEGSYSYNSLRKFLKNKYEKIIGYHSFKEIFIALKNKEITHGYIPIENTIGGKINENINYIKEYKIDILEKYKFKINHCLLSKKGVNKNDINVVISHWQALAQCSDYLSNNNYVCKEFFDTSGACKNIQNKNLNNTGAIASKECSKIYDLKIIDENIQNNDNNYTTFYLVKNIS